MAVLPNRQLFNCRGQVVRNVGKPKEANNAMTFAVPSFTTTDKNALVATNGMIIYDSTLNKIQGYQNGSWQNLI